MDKKICSDGNLVLPIQGYVQSCALLDEYIGDVELTDLSEEAIYLIVVLGDDTRPIGSRIIV